MWGLGLLVAALALFGSGECARDEDLVDYLPMLDVQPEFKHYAGFLSATGTKKFFYWFVESENNPAEDPVVLWLNGGPGCSSMTGKLVELGPWRVNKTGGLNWFEHRWNKIANIIFMESPQCVGFSHDLEGNCTSGDDQTALDNHEALKDFFRGFPEYKDNEFFVTGESYAGIYVPTLSARLVDDPEFNFKGMAVGNAVTDRPLMANSYVFFAWGRGLFGSDLMNDILDECCVDRNATNCEVSDTENQRCKDLYNEVNENRWRRGLNPYNVYDECYGGVPSREGVVRESADTVDFLVPDDLGLSQEHLQQYLQNMDRMAADKFQRLSIPCTDTSDRDLFLNNPDVRRALHVPEYVQEWAACSANVSRNYKRQYQTVKAEFLKVLERGHHVLVFFGDLDQACDHLSGMWFVERLGQEVVEPFKSWTYPAEDETTQIAGWVSQYRRLKFVSVKGAGHFVPTDKPVPAYIMWEKFLNDEPY